MIHRKCSYAASTTGSPSRMSTHALSRFAAADLGETVRFGHRREQLVVLAEGEILELAPRPRAGRGRGRRRGGSGSASARCAASRAIPSERSSIACACAASRRPSARRSGGRTKAPRRNAAPAAPSGPGDDERVSGLRAGASGHPLGAADRGHGEQQRVGSRRVAAEHAHARLRDSLVELDNVVDGVSAGAPSETIRPSGVAPDAARSLRLTAAARKPSSRHVIQSSRKCTPSTSASCVTTSAVDLRRVVVDRVDEAAALELGEQPALADVRKPAHRSRRAPRVRRGSRAGRRRLSRPRRCSRARSTASIPPIAMTGTRTASQIAASPSSPIGARRVQLRRRSPRSARRRCTPRPAPPRRSPRRCSTPRSEQEAGRARELLPVVAAAEVDAVGVERERRLDVVVHDERDVGCAAQLGDRPARLDDGERRRVLQPQLDDGRATVDGRRGGVGVVDDGSGASRVSRSSHVRPARPVSRL